MKCKLKKQSIGWLALSCAIAWSIQPLPSYSAPVLSAQPGLSAANFTTTKGWIQVNFPFDMSGGDTISGTILVEPKATSAREQASAEKDMGNYTVVIDSVETKVSEGEFTMKVPKDVSSIQVQLKNKSGQVLGTQDVKVSKLDKKYANYFVSGVSQSGETLQVWGAFDGVFGTTQGTVNGQRLDKLAESTRQVVLALPAAPPGRVNFTLSEQNTEVSGSCPVLNVEMQQSNSFVSKGKTTEIAITVTGVASLEKAVELVIQNYSPEQAELVGGNPLRVPVTANSSNVFQYKCNVNGIRPGTLTLSAIVTSPDYLPVKTRSDRANPSPVAAANTVVKFSTPVESTDDPISLVCGDWQSSFGTVRISKIGAVVGDALAINGSWDQSPVKKGVIKNGIYRSDDRTLEFDYYQDWNDKTGTAKFSMSRDGKIMTGNWKQGTENGEWVMKR